MTSLYTFRLIFVTFHGEAKTEAHAGHGVTYWLPLSVLIVLSTNPSIGAKAICMGDSHKKRAAVYGVGISIKSSRVTACSHSQILPRLSLGTTKPST